MNLSDINFQSLNKIESFGNSPKPVIYNDENFYYKLIHSISLNSRTSLGYYMLDGLNFIWLGNDKLASDRVGLINYNIVPAFKEFIYDDNICCGYIMHKGTPLSGRRLSKAEYIEYLSFINKLADISIECGYGIVSTNLDNIIKFDKKLSLIDLDFSPIKLRHNYKFSEYENKAWENEFRSFNGLYLKTVKDKLADY